MDTGVGFINLDDSVKIALNIALAVARENANECYTPSHLLKALLHKDVGLRDFIISIGKDLGYLEEWADVHIEQCPKSTRFAEIKPSEKIDAVFRAADDARIQMGLFDINPICVLLALTKPGIAFSSDQLRSFPILEKDIHSIYTGNESAATCRRVSFKAPFPLPLPFLPSIAWTLPPPRQTGFTRPSTVTGRTAWSWRCWAAAVNRTC